MTFCAKQRLALVLLCVCLAGCSSIAQPPASLPAAQPAALPSIQIEVLAHQSCEGLGACQGASIHDGFIYLYGDLYQKEHRSGPGVIRQYSFRPDEHGVPRLTYTGLKILLTRHGETLINHPTGLTWNPTSGAYLGNTVTKTKKGTIYHLNWTQMLIDRNLDNAVLNVTDDDLAVQGCRPEFVRHDQRWLLATADYGQVNNAVRMYDPELLANAKSTSEPSVLVERFPCTPWVQQLHWIDARGLLIIAQNQIEGRRWRLTPACPWKPDAPADFRAIAAYDELPFPTELEGFCMIDREYCVLVNSSSKENVTIGRLKVLKEAK
ncbi:MAG: hypothetical protein JWN24_3705 [Phycisphaerales bacterium]|nr:hypothetical protein [Phycisphaerales bacterium]